MDVEAYLEKKYDCFKKDDELYNFSFEQMRIELCCGKNTLQAILKALAIRKSLTDPFGGYNWSQMKEAVLLGLDELDRMDYIY